MRRLNRYALLLTAAFLTAPLQAQDDTLQPPSKKEWGEIVERSQRKAIPEDEAPDVVLEEDELRVTLYDIRDLVLDLAPSSHSLPKSLEGEYVDRLDTEHAKELKTALDGLTNAVRRHVGPPMDSKANPLGVQIIEDRLLVVSGTEQQHEWVKSFLLRLRRGGTAMVKVETRCIEIPRGALAALGAKTPPMGAVGPEHEAVVATVLQNAFQKKEGWELTSSPQLVVHPLRKATLSLVNQMAYVKEWRVTMVQPEATLIADPVIDVIEEGFSFDYVVTPLPGDRYAVDVEFWRAAVERPIETRKVRVATDPATDNTISIPVVTRMTIESTFTAASGKAIAFVTPANDQDRDLLVWIQVSPIRMPGGGGRIQALGYASDESPSPEGPRVEVEPPVEPAPSDGR